MNHTSLQTLHFPVNFPPQNKDIDNLIFIAILNSAPIVSNALFLLVQDLCPSTIFDPLLVKVLPLLAGIPQHWEH